MADTRLKLLAAGLVAGLAAACASQPPLAPGAGFESGETTSSTAPAESLPVASGFQINGENFAGDLVYEDRDGRVVALYRHAVDGADTLVADMDVNPAFLTDGVRRFNGVSDRGVEMTIEMVSGRCEANGRVHARFVTVFAGRLTFDGCAREVGPTVSWTENLPRYLQDIDACEAEARQTSMAFARRGEGAVVHARREGRTSVLRYEYGDSGRWECSVNGSRVNWTIVPETADTLPGEGLPRFIPGRIPNAGEGCYLYERVETAQGRVLGALAHDVCTPGFAALSSARFG